ncbi:FHA domain-containing protein [bacterium]|nr:FHA domain-containing protein [bacterium]
MATANRQWLLKVFSGPHKDAEIILMEGQNMIGSGDQCDIVLADPQIEEQHVELSVAGDRATCTAIGDAKVFVEGELISSSPLQPFDYVTIGTTYFAIGYSDADWPSRPLPEIIDNSSAAPGDEEPRSEETAQGDAAAMPTPAGTDKNKNQNEPNAEEGFLAGRSWVIALIALQVLLVIGLFILFGYGQGDSENDSQPQVSQADLEKIISDIAPDSSVKISQQGDQFFASGYVLSRAKAGTLEDALIAADPGIDTADLDDMEVIVRNASRLLDLRDLRQLEVTATVPGRIEVAGTVKDLEDWKKAKNELERQIRLPLDDEVVTERGVSLVKKTIPKPTRPVAPPVEEKTNPNNTADGMPGMVAVGPVVRVPLSIHHVTIGRTKFVTTSTGIDLREGSLAPGGYQVKQIEVDRVVLSKNNQDIVVMFDQQ